MDDVRTEAFHFPAHINQHRNRSQCSHDSADSHSVRNCLAETVALWDLEIGHRARAITADLDHIDCIGGALECHGTIGCDFNSSRSAESLGDSPRNNLRCLETVLVDIKQADFRVGKLGKGKDISEQILCKDSTSGADKGDLPW
jgi:hypothetical protein